MLNADVKYHNTGMCYRNRNNIIVNFIGNDGEGEP